MFPRVTHVRHIHNYVLELTFTDGVVAQLDFAPRVLGRGAVFQPLQDLEFFSQAHVDPEAGTLVWPNEVDLDPDVLYSQATGKPLPEFEPSPVQ